MVSGFHLPQQLKAEFVGRIAGAAERYRANVPDGALSSLLWGADPVYHSVANGPVGYHARPP